MTTKVRASCGLNRVRLPDNMPSVWADMVKAGAEFVHSDEFKVYQDEHSMDFLCEAAGSISIGTRSMAASGDADVSMESTYDGEAISIEITKQSCVAPGNLGSCGMLNDSAGTLTPR
jgi:hypothetical protein